MNKEVEFKDPQFLPISSFVSGQKINLIGLSLEELQSEMKKIDEKPFKVRQIWNWIYAKGVGSDGMSDFALMSNVSKETKKILEANYSLQRLKVNQDLLSKDGTRKWLIKFSDCREAEMVFIPEGDRGTLCISSQIGCTLTCKFCHTGTQLLVRNLSAGEIVGQFMLARDLLKDWNGEKRKITSIVFMGMGEPLFNYDNVKRAIEIFNDSNGINFSRRKITVSTSGVVPELMRFADEIKAVLAVSLHSANDEIRSRIMPLNKKYPLKELMKACSYYTQKTNGDRITFEYVMLKGVNDSDEDAFDLVKLLKQNKLSALVNLIPFNPWVGSGFECSSRNRIMAFGRVVKNAGYTTTIRKTKGQDVMAACGQLKSQTR